MSAEQHSSIWSDYSVCRENTANISLTAALRFALCLCFLHWGIIGLLSVSVGMLAVCRVHCGLPGGTLTSLQPFPVTVAHNWPHVSKQRLALCMCAFSSCALACQSPRWRTDPWAPRSPGPLWRHSVSFETLGTAEIVQSVLFYKVKVEGFGKDVLYLIAVEYWGNNVETHCREWDSARNVIRKNNSLLSAGSVGWHCRMKPFIPRVVTLIWVSDWNIVGMWRAGLTSM